MAESAWSVGMRVVGDPQLLSVPVSRAVDGRVAARSQPQRVAARQACWVDRFGTSTMKRVVLVMDHRLQSARVLLLDLYGEFVD